MPSSTCFSSTSNKLILPLDCGNLAVQDFLELVRGQPPPIDGMELAQLGCLNTPRERRAWAYTKAAQWFIQEALNAATIALATVQDLWGR